MEMAEIIPCMVGVINVGYNRPAIIEGLDEFLTMRGLKQCFSLAQQVDPVNRSLSQAGLVIGLFE